MVSFLSLRRSYPSSIYNSDNPKTANRKEGGSVANSSSLGENVTAGIGSTAKKLCTEESEHGKESSGKNTTPKPALRNDMYRNLSVNRKQYQTYSSNSEASIVITGELLGQETDGLSRLQEEKLNSLAKVRMCSSHRSDHFVNSGVQLRVERL